MMVPHQTITSVESYLGNDAPCMFQGCQASATKIAHTTNAPGSKGPVGLAIEVPYCDRHLDAVMSGRAAEVAQADRRDSPTEIGPGLLPLRVAGVVVAALALAFVYSPDTPVEWFVTQAILIVLIFVFPQSRFAAVISGAWLVYFWVPLGVFALTQLGVLAKP